MLRSAEAAIEHFHNRAQPHMVGRHDVANFIRHNILAGLRVLGMHRNDDLAWLTTHNLYQCFDPLIRIKHVPVSTASCVAPPGGVHLIVEHVGQRRAEHALTSSMLGLEQPCSVVPCQGIAPVRFGSAAAGMIAPLDLTTPLRLFLRIAKGRMPRAHPLHVGLKATLDRLGTAGNAEALALPILD